MTNKKKPPLQTETNTNVTNILPIDHDPSILIQLIQYDHRHTRDLHGGRI